MPAADPTSLERLVDLVVPAPVAWWPPAPGWWVVAGVVLVLAVGLGWRAWRRWQAAAYRRAARAELEALAQRLVCDADGPPVLAALAGLLKRTALAAFPRETVAALSGTAWLGFLDHTGRTDAFTRGGGRVLADVAYDPRAASRMDASQMQELLAVARKWIDAHEAAC